MDGYIDIHSHILPSLDDGSKSMEQTLHMLQLAYDEGIRSIITTPHFRENCPTDLAHKQEAALYKLQDNFKNALPNINLFIGSEIYYSHDCLQLLKDKLIPTMANSRYALVEFSPMADYRYIKQGLQHFIFEGYRPILAHVERYRNIKLDAVSEFIHMGSYIQINTTNFYNETLEDFFSISKKLLQNHLVHFIATDCHNDTTRKPKLKEVIHYLHKKYGETYVRELLIDNPQKILENNYIR